MSSVDHDPSKSLVRFLTVSYLSDGRSDLGSHILFFLDNVFLSKFELEGHFAGIGFYRYGSFEVREAFEYFGYCKRA